MEVDRDHRGHDYAAEGEATIAGRAADCPRLYTASSDLRAPEATFGHSRGDHRMGRNFLLEPFGDEIDGLTDAAGYNLPLTLPSASSCPDRGSMQPVDSG
jgi:hypothetical protein